jgi:hypothetical protein
MVSARCSTGSNRCQGPYRRRLIDGLHYTELNLAEKANVLIKMSKSDKMFRKSEQHFRQLSAEYCHNSHLQTFLLDHPELFEKDFVVDINGNIDRVKV